MLFKALQGQRISGRPPRGVIDSKKLWPGNGARRATRKVRLAWRRKGLAWSPSRDQNRPTRSPPLPVPKAGGEAGRVARPKGYAPGRWGPARQSSGIRAMRLTAAQRRGVGAGNRCNCQRRVVQQQHTRTSGHRRASLPGEAGSRVSRFPILSNKPTAHRPRFWAWLVCGRRRSRHSTNREIHHTPG